MPLSFFCMRSIAGWNDAAPLPCYYLLDFHLRLTQLHRVESFLGVPWRVCRSAHFICFGLAAVGLISLAGREYLTWDVLFLCC